MTEDARLEPEHSFTVRYTEAIAREAVRAYVWRRIVLANKPLWLTSVALAALAVWLAAHGDRSWFLGLFAAGALAPILMVAVGWRAHFVNTVGRFRRMRTPEARFEIFRDALSIKAEDGEASIRWPAIVELWALPRVWVAFLAPNQFFLLPVEDVPPDALAAFRARAGRPTTPSSAPVSTP